ncbi:MAG: carbohydrate-binding domain-containing protein [Alistipes sp.]|nr:carbohydrate-binding domain-containing protein [Alistipes sp.]
MYPHIYKFLTLITALCLALSTTSCDISIDTPMNSVDTPSQDDDTSENKTTENDNSNEDNDSNEGDDTEMETTFDIDRWEGMWADDKSSDIVGDNNDFFYELNTFNNVVKVIFDNDKATIQSSNNAIVSHITGAYVALDLSAVSNVEIIAMGITNDGGLKIYSDNKYKLTLNGVDITSQRGPAINSQSKKRVFIHLAEDTTNRLTDCATYSEDSYIIPGAVDEDRKGCLFAEGNIILSGYGALMVAGKQKHAIVTDGCYYQRPGVTVAITESAKNGIHVKGDSDDNTGAVIKGGAITASVGSTAGKGIKCDMDIVVDGGKFDIRTSGNATYDSEDKDTSSASCLKSDTDIHINGGSLNLSSSGTGGKGISSDGNLIIDGGDINISTTGGQYRYSNSLTSSPKGIRADGNIDINGGHLNISVTGASEGSEGLESKMTLTFNGGETIINAYDDAINAAKALVLNDGKVYARATNNDGIDSNGSLTINGGLMIGIGSREPEGGIDVDNSTSLVINGGTAIGIGGAMMGKPSTSSKQYSVVYGGATATQGSNIAVLDASNNTLFTFELPQAMSNSTLFFSTPEISNGATYTISSGGTIADYNNLWQGWYDGGVWSGGTALTTFTPSSVVTTIGNTGGGPGGPGGGGDWPGGGGGWPGRP